jgi:hypothetical protein
MIKQVVKNNYFNKIMIFINLNKIHKLKINLSPQKRHSKMSVVMALSQQMVYQELQWKHFILIKVKNRI